MFRSSILCLQLHREVKELDGGKDLSATHNRETEWKYRITEQRRIQVKAKNDQVGKVSVIDLSTNLPFPVEPTEDFPIDSLNPEKGYFATLKIYTSKNLKNVDESMISFFEVVDVNRTAEDFIKAYWLYPNLIRFELVEVEPL
jgi:hypothetical protein